ncbi:MAG: conjugal transfer protein, partial [Ruminococcus sp.]|nr:conjugal transfer protein [Ruminococcus sp.]
MNTKEAIDIPKTTDSSKAETTKTTTKETTTTTKKTTTSVVEAAPPETTTETTAVTTTAMTTYTSAQSFTENIDGGDESYAQTGVSEYIPYQTTQTSYSGHTETAPYEGGYTSEEDSSETVSSETEVSSEEISSVTEQPAISLNAKQAQAFTLLAGAFGVVIAVAVIFIKMRGKKSKTEKDDLSALTAKERDEIRIKEESRKKPKEKKIKKKRPAPKTVQKTLPYQRVCDEYIIKVDDNKYSKTYQFEDINYQIAKQDEQESIFLGYCSVLNSFDTNADIQITVHNNRVNKVDFERMVLIKHKGDGFDSYRDAYNDMLIEKMEQGQNGIIRNKYITVTLQAADLENAQTKFNTIDLELLNAFKKIGSAIKPLTSNERVNLLKDIFRNVDEEIPELTDKHFKRQAERAYCCPDYLEFKKDYFMWGDKYARTMFIKDMPASLKDNMLTDIANTNLDVMISVNIAPVDPYKALKIVNHQLTSMRANKLQAEKKAIQSGYTSDVINEDLKHSLIEAEELLDDLRSKNQKMFLDNIIIMVTAKDMEELESNTEAIEAVVRKHICSLGTLKFQQEKGLQSVLPLGNCTLKIRR